MTSVITGFNTHTQMLIDGNIVTSLVDSCLDSYISKIRQRSTYFWLHHSGLLHILVIPGNRSMLSFHLILKLKSQNMFETKLFVSLRLAINDKKYFYFIINKSLSLTLSLILYYQYHQNDVYFRIGILLAIKIHIC